MRGGVGKGGVQAALFNPRLLANFG